MRIVKIEEKYKNRKSIFFLELLESIISENEIVIENLQSIFEDINNSYDDKISDKILKNLYYFLYLLFKDQEHIFDTYPNTDNGRPKDGFEFYDKDTGESLAVYHAHISDINNGVLIWYFELNEYNVPEWRFIFEEHPIDGYKEVLKEIYNSPNTIDIVTFEFLHDKKYLIRESLVKTFLEFKDGRDNRRSISHEKIKERFPNYKKARPSKEEFEKLCELPTHVPMGGFYASLYK